MKRKDMETKLSNAFSSLSAPDVLDSVLSDCQTKKGAIIMMQDRKKTPTITRWAGIAAAFILVLGIAGIYNANYTVASTVSLDVNPSVEIQANRSDKVLAVTANNRDGQIILGDMDFEGSDLDVAVNALIGSMVRNGYLTELANSILISVDSNDPARSEELELRLAQEINALLQTETFSGSVLSQTIAQDHALQSTADQHGITVGKAQLIQEIIDQDPRYTFDTLADLSINELNLIHQTAPAETLQVATTGTASDKAYIGAETARETALAYAGISEIEAGFITVEYDYEWGVMVYEVEFHVGSYEYTIDVNAATGEVVHQEKEWDDDGGDRDDAIGSENLLNTPDDYNGPDISGYIDAETAKTAALDHAGVAAADAVGMHCELDEDDGVAVYEIEFHAGNYEYSYEIDAATGAVREREREWRD